MVVRQGWVFTTSGKAIIDSSATSQRTKIIIICAPFGLDSFIFPSQALHKSLPVNWLNHGELCSVGLYGYNPSKACKHAWDYSTVDDVICMKTGRNSFLPFECLAHPKEIPLRLLLPQKCQGAGREERITYPCLPSVSHLKLLDCHRLAASYLASHSESPQVVKFKELM